ncbi:hypothetical protein V1511DRAFT_458568 [Dipodascopsis uninucleata]
MSGICAHCGEDLESPTIRAMDRTFHRGCFVCVDCGKSVIDQFFPLEVASSDLTERSKTVPLCERDFFKRKNLLCHVCGEALRGDYVMAVGHKYHLEHFTCSICSHVFQAEDNYYERDGQVYCHFHFSTLFAERCEGCQSAILKQFIENLRNGRHEHWHPECYMIHKFWNVRLATANRTISQAPAYDSTNISNSSTPNSHIYDDDGKLSPEALKQKQRVVENKVYKIWTILSSFEEVSAACISDMLQYSTNDAPMDAVLATGRLIYRIQILFRAIDNLPHTKDLNSRPLGKEPKTLCKNIVNFLTTLPTNSVELQNTMTKDLLDLVTSMAHYLKLLMQYGLDTALRQDKIDPSSHSIDRFLTHMSSNSPPPPLSRETLIPNITDQCMVCKNGIEEKCARFISIDLIDKRDRRRHLTNDCFLCARCGRTLSNEIPDTYWVDSSRTLLCVDCVEPNDNARRNAFEFISRLNQYGFLLNVALHRVFRLVYEASQEKSDILYRASSTDKFESVEGYVNTLTDIRRLRSSRFKRTISDANANKTARKTKTLPVTSSTASKLSNGKPTNNDSVSDSDNTSPPSVIKPLPKKSIESNSPPMDKTDILFGEKYLTLDDIPRIVAAEQAREQRPNAFRHQRQSSLALGSGPMPKLINQNNGTADKPISAISNVSTNASGSQKFFSELQNVEYFLVRHFAAQALRPLVTEFFSSEELNQILSEPRITQSNGGSGSKMGFWEKFGKAFSKNGTSHSNSGKSKKGMSNGISIGATFNVPLEILVERTGTDSELGISKGRLKVPLFLDDCISAMRRKDMSVEGVFRKNGNIRKLKALAEQIDKVPPDALSVNLDDESPVQLAALLKKFLRELPDPLLTFKLHKLWIASQRISDDSTRRRVLHLVCCLLPRSHRDSMEIIFNFLKWVASFSHVDEESGSKMDIHNLSTVITPNILYPSNSNPEDIPTIGGIAGDSYFLAIEAVNSLIENHEEFSVVPEDVMESVLSNNGSGASDIE